VATPIDSLKCLDRNRSEFVDSGDAELTTGERAKWAFSLPPQSIKGKTMTRNVRTTTVQDDYSQEANARSQVVKTDRTLRRAKVGAVMSHRQLLGLVGATMLSVVLVNPALAAFTSVDEAMAGYESLKHGGIAFDNNEPANIAQLSNKHLLVVNFWAYWCTNCIQEFADLKRLQDRYGDNNITVILVSEEKNWDRDVATARRLGVNWRMAKYSDAIGLANKGKMLGHTIVGDRLNYALPVSWVVLNDRPLTTYEGNPGWSDGDAARFIAKLFK